MRREAIYHLEFTAMRDCLAISKGQRLAFSGVFEQTDRWTQPNGRIYATACLQAVEHDGVLIAPHLWVHHAEPIKNQRPQFGERVQLTALVREYLRRLKLPNERGDLTELSYSLDRPDQVVFPGRQAAAGPPPAVAAVPVILQCPAIKAPATIAEKIQAVQRLAEQISWTDLEQLVQVLRPRAAAQQAA